MQRLTICGCYKFVMNHNNLLFVSDVAL